MFGTLKVKTRLMITKNPIWDARSFEAAVPGHR